ncbi:hypothetical protein LXL04_006289 [Taraxacum kok-saghyz]
MVIELDLDRDYNDYNEEVDEDSGDSDYIVDPEALVDDWDVDMREFDNGLVNIVMQKEDMRKRMLKNLNKNVACSSGEVHAKSFFVGQNFKTKKEVKEHIKLLAIHSRKDLHIAKNDKIRVRVVCRGIISGTDGESDGGPSTNNKVTCKGKKVNEKKESFSFAIQISRSNEEEPWLVKTVNDKCDTRQNSIVKSQLFCNGQFLLTSKP